MAYRTIDISKQCNHKLIYDEFPKDKKLFGLDNICLLKHDFINKDRALKKDIVCDYCFGDYDNIVCEGQEIVIDAAVKKWHFIGFAYWGDTNEVFKVIYDDNTEDWIEITFIDWAFPFVQDRFNMEFTHGNKIENIQVAVTAGELVHLVYLHDCICEFYNQKKVKAIILPNNILVHIFALTIEY